MLLQPFRPDRRLTGHLAYCTRLSVLSPRILADLDFSRQPQSDSRIVHAAVFGKCNQAGVRIIAGSDGPGVGTLLPGFALHRELELLVASGLSPLQALRAATSTAAEALGKEDLLGTIERGKLADLVVVDADPLERIQNLQKIRLVVQGGRTYAPDVLLQQLRSEASQKR